MKNKLFSGIMPAMITPFDENGALKAESAHRIMDRELNRGVNGFYVNGATGEGLFLSEATRREMAETAVENRPLHGSRQEQNIQNHHPHRRPLHFYCFRNGICRFARPPPRSLCTGRSQKRMTK